MSFGLWEIFKNPDKRAAFSRPGGGRILLPRELDFEIGLALARDDPKIAIALETCTEFHFYLVWQLGQVSNRVFQNLYKFAERTQGRFERFCRHRSKFAFCRDL